MKNRQPMFDSWRMSFSPPNRSVSPSCSSCRSLIPPDCSVQAARDSALSFARQHGISRCSTLSVLVLQWVMKTYIHAQLNEEDRTILRDLKHATGRSESELVRHGLRLVLEEVRPKKSALELAATSAGKFKKGPRDLSTNKKHLEGFGA